MRSWASSVGRVLAVCLNESIPLNRGMKQKPHSHTLCQFTKKNGDFLVKKLYLWVPVGI